MALTKINGNTQIRDASIFDAQIAANADIQTSKLQDGAKLIFNDGTRAFTSTIAGVTPTLPAHLTTKEYVDSVATGLDVKPSVRAISTADITLSAPQTIDGVSVLAGDRVLVAGQTDASENGIYVVGAGAWVRSADADNSPVGEVTSGMFTFVEEGTAFAGTGWVLTTANPIVLDTTDLVFAQFSQAGVIVAGAGLTKSGITLDVVSDNGGIVVNADNIALTLDGSTLSVGAGGLKLADLADGKILIGNGSNVATAQTLSGDVTISNTGVATIAGGAVTLGKIEALGSAKFIIGTGAGNAQVSMSGDATMDDAGAVTIDSSVVVKVADVITRETPSGTLDGVNAVFMLANTPKTGTEHVYVNGLLMDAGAGNDYTISGNTITFTFGPVAADKIRVSYFK